MPRAFPAPTGTAAPQPANALALLTARLRTDPVLSARLRTLDGLSARREEVVADLQGTQRALEAWREENEGFKSNRRLALGVVHAVADVAQDVGELVGRTFRGEAPFDSPLKNPVADLVSTAKDPELLGPAPQRARLQALQSALSEIDEGMKALAEGQPLTARPDGDWRVKELAAEQSKGPRPTPELLKERVKTLEAHVSKGDADGARELYLAALTPALLAADDRGESVQRTDGGARLSLTGQVNQLILAGAIDTGGRLVSTAEDLRAARSGIAAVHGYAPKAKAQEAQAALAALTPEALDGEEQRLQRLTQRGPLASLLPSVQAANAALAKVGAGPGLLGSVAGGVGAVLDSPQTLLMLGVGAMTAGVATPLLLGNAAVGAADVSLALRALLAARRAGALQSSGALQAGAGVLGRGLGTAAVNGALFTVGMNAANHALGERDLVDWSGWAFARNAALFAVLGGVEGAQLLRPLAQTRPGKLAQGTLALGEQGLALTSVALAEQLLRQGNLAGAGALLQHNLEFLLALRLLGAARVLTQRGKEDPMKALRQAEAVARSAAGRTSRAASYGDLVRQLIASRDHALAFDAALASSSARGLPALGRAHVELLSARDFEAVVDAIGASSAGHAKSPEEASYARARAADAKREGKAFFDPALGRTFVNREWLEDPRTPVEARVSALRHEKAHEVWAGWSDAQRNQVIDAVLAPPGFAQMKASLEAEVGTSLSPARVVEEAFAQWRGGAPGEVAAAVGRALSPLSASLGLDAPQPGLRDILSASTPYWRRSGETALVGHSGAPRDGFGPPAAKPPSASNGAVPAAERLPSTDPLAAAAKSFTAPWERFDFDRQAPKLAQELGTLGVGQAAWDPVQRALEVEGEGFRVTVQAAGTALEVNLEGTVPGALVPALDAAARTLGAEQVSVQVPAGSPAVASLLELRYRDEDGRLVRREQPPPSGPAVERLASALRELDPDARAVGDGVELPGLRGAARVLTHEGKRSLVVNLAQMPYGETLAGLHRVAKASKLPFLEVQLLENASPFDLAAEATAKAMRDQGFEAPTALRGWRAATWSARGLAAVDRMEAVTQALRSAELVDRIKPQLLGSLDGHYARVDLHPKVGDRTVYVMADPSRPNEARVLLSSAADAPLLMELEPALRAADFTTVRVEAGGATGKDVYTQHDAELYDAARNLGYREQQGRLSTGLRKSLTVEAERDLLSFSDPRVRDGLATQLSALPGVREAQLQGDGATLKLKGTGQVLNLELDARGPLRALVVRPTEPGLPPLETLRALEAFGRETFEAQELAVVTRGGDALSLREREGYEYGAGAYRKPLTSERRAPELATRYEQLASLLQKDPYVSNIELDAARGEIEYQRQAPGRGGLQTHRLSASPEGLWVQRLRDNRPLSPADLPRNIEAIASRAGAAALWVKAPARTSARAEAELTEGGFVREEAGFRRGVTPTLGVPLLSSFRSQIHELAQQLASESSVRSAEAFAAEEQLALTLHSGAKVDLWSDGDVLRTAPRAEDEAALTPELLQRVDAVAQASGARESVITGAASSAARGKLEALGYQEAGGAFRRTLVRPALDAQSVAQALRSELPSLELRVGEGQVELPAYGLTLLTNLDGQPVLHGNVAGAFRAEPALPLALQVALRGRFQQLEVMEPLESARDPFAQTALEDYGFEATPAAEAPGWRTALWSDAEVAAARDTLQMAHLLRQHVVGQVTPYLGGGQNHLLVADRLGAGPQWLVRDTSGWKRDADMSSPLREGLALALGYAGLPSLRNDALKLSDN